MGMRKLNASEKRTIRLGAIALAAYLVLYLGLSVWRYSQQRQADYQRLTSRVAALHQQLDRQTTRALRLEKLKQRFHIEPAGLSPDNLVAEASSAIQKAATSGGVQLGPLRESPGRPSAKELASMRLEGVGPVPAVLALLPRLETLGYPLLIDSVQLDRDPTKPMMLKISLSIVVLDYAHWEAEKGRRA
jgi:hypothetical protein